MKYKKIFDVLPVINCYNYCKTSIMKKDKRQRVTLFLNPNLWRHAKAQAMVEGISLTTLIEKALSEYLPKEIILRKEDT